MRPLLVAACLALGAGSAAAWELRARGTATALALGPRGDVVVGSVGVGGFGVPQLQVHRLSDAGATRWRFRGAFGIPRALVVDADGTVIAAGELLEATPRPALFVVLGLTARTGRERWRLEGAPGRADAVDVAAGGAVAVGRSGGAFTVVRLDAATGMLAWSAALPASAPDDEAQAVTLDAAGDVVAAGTSGGALVVWKLDGVTGAERWRSALAGGVARAVRILPGGDVLVAGTLGGFALARLAGDDGAERWRQVIGGGAAHALALDATDAVAAGTLHVDGVDRFAVVNLAASTGTERWRATVGVGAAGDCGVGLAVDRRGRSLATGVASTAAGDAQLALVRVDADGTVHGAELRDGTAHDPDPDAGVAVVVDGRGRPIVAGTLGRALPSGTSAARLLVRRLAR